jgi:hypothetical protein
MSGWRGCNRSAQKLFTNTARLPRALWNRRKTHGPCPRREGATAYGLSLAQVEQQLTSDNTNASGSFVEAGLQQINIREVGLVRNVEDIANTVILTKGGTPDWIRELASRFLNFVRKARVEMK